MTTSRTCGNCCFCKSPSTHSTGGICVLSGKATIKEKTALELKCKKHLYRAEEEK